MIRLRGPESFKWLCGGSKSPLLRPLSASVADPGHGSEWSLEPGALIVMVIPGRRRPSRCRPPSTAARRHGSCPPAGSTPVSAQLGHLDSSFDPVQPVAAPPVRQPRPPVRSRTVSQELSGRSCAEPDDECCDGDSAEADVAASVVSRCDRSGVLELVDGTFDGVPLLVSLRVEARRPPAPRAHALADGLTVRLLRDCVPDAAPAQVVAARPVAIGPVGGQAVGRRARSACTGSRDTDLLQHGYELRAVRPLSRCDDQG